MKKIKRKTKAILIIIVVCVILFSYAGAVFFQLPERAVISDINKNLDTPYKMLEKREDMSLGNCGVIGGFGVDGYFDSKYGALDEEGSFDVEKNKAVVYYVTSWPDTVIGSGRVTRIVCADPEYSLYGCSVGGYASGFKRELAEHGFEKTGGNLGGERFEKNGVSISYAIDSETNRVSIFTVSVNNSNLFRIMY